MSRRWLLSLSCLSLLLLSLVQLTRAVGELRVNEANTRILLEKTPAEVILAVENSTGEILNATVDLELLDPKGNSHAKTSEAQSIKNGTQTLTLSLPFSFSKLTEKERNQLLWYRLHYRITKDRTLAEGLVSLSEITPDLFDVRVATAEIAREGGRYRARVQTSHPVTRRPAANVRIDGEVTLEDDNDKSVKLHASRITDSKGYAILEFTIPPQFPAFPHRLQPSGGELHVVASRGAFVAEVSDDVLVDQFARVLISTDKPLYQPGQLMHVRALLFTPSKRAMANQNILIRIADPEELTIFRTVVKSSRFGIANTEWPIPENTRLGDYRIWVGIDGGEESSQMAQDVRISRYDLPNFTVNVAPDRKFYLPGQNAAVKVRADYLFGQPVLRGHVRVVRETEREWNYREQKWDIKEGDKYEGETDADGFFVAHINLAEDHKDLTDDSYQRFQDVTYAAYFTDPTTNRTEQRRFDLRLTREPIHVYVLQDEYDWDQNRKLPFRFYVSTFYADGTPARCKVDVRLTSTDVDSTIKRSLATVRSNRYGLVKVSGVRVPKDLEDESEVRLLVSATDARGAKGTNTREMQLDNREKIIVETDKTLYRAGEPITAAITASLPDLTLVVDVTRDSSVIHSERVKLDGTRRSITFPYTPDFKDQVTIAAYPDFRDSDRGIGTRTVLYPRNPELKVNLRSSQNTYRPGEDAHVNVNVRAPEGGSAESALGVVVLDRAVEERARTDQEFGHHYSYGFKDALQSFVGSSQQLAGVSLRDLQQLDMSKVVSPDLDLLADILLNQNRNYYPRFEGGDQFELDQNKVYGDLIKAQLDPIRDALGSRYVDTAEYPKNEADLRRLLSLSQIDFDTVRDPWGMTYRPEFYVEKQYDVLKLWSAGGDKRFDTKDDIFASRQSWQYFRPVGEAIDKAVQQYHSRTGGFIRQSATLNDEVSKNGFNLDQLRDRWGEPYRFEFAVSENNFMISVKSSGPDKRFASNQINWGDDFVIWTSLIDYFAEPRAQLDVALTDYLKTTKKFPQNDQQLREAVPNSLLEQLRDPWDRPYYRVFKTESSYADRVRLENRAAYGSSTTSKTVITPVTRQVTSVTLRSVGPDGQAGTVDDFTVATFAGVLSEQEREQRQPETVVAGVVFSGNSGAIYGVVKDANDAAVPNATIVATRMPGNETYRSATNDEGKFTISGLPAGLYEVRFQAPGFVLAVFTNVLVRVSNLTEINPVLEVGDVVEAVTVTSSTVTMQTNAADVSQSVSRSTVLGTNTQIITKSGAISTPRLRDYFPETLLWQPSIETDKQGRAQISFKLADNITTWKMAVIGSTEDGRIGATETEIRAFQPFFVEHDPPRVLTEGDQISLPVVVRNYLDRTQKVDLEIKPEQWFSLLGPARKQTEVAGGDATRETFDLRAIASIKDGKQRVTAIGGDGNDAIEKPVTVHPDGEESSVTAGDILGNSALLELNVPENIIRNSKQAELKIYPNLLAHVVESTEAIMQRPYGCAEQTISAAYPSLLLLRHYKKQGQDFPLRGRAQRYVNDGYSRLLNYRDENGGFTYWGHGEPDIALTAYALHFLTDAAEVIPVDENVIKHTREWLSARQQADGSWPAHEYWTNLSGNRMTLMLTAYVARVLATTDNAKPSETLKRALDYLAQQGLTIDEPYLLGSYALAAIDAGELARAKPIVDKLRTLARQEGNMSYWVLETNTPFYGWGLAGRVETTAIVVQALKKYCDSQAANYEADTKLINRALLFLLKQKDRYGVWYSTQATINVLDAMLTLFAKNAANEDVQSAANIIVNGRVVQTLQLTADRMNNPITFDVTQFVSPGKNTIEIKRESRSAAASVQAVVNYYVPWATNKVENHSSNLRLVTKFDKTEAKVSDEITCNVEAERIGFRGYGMLLAEIGVPPGADVDRSSLDTAVKSSNWAISQYDVLPDRVMVYLWPQGGGVKFKFKFRPRFGVNAKTASSVVYDYYNPESRAVVAPATFQIK